MDEALLAALPVVVMVVMVVATAVMMAAKEKAAVAALDGGERESGSGGVGEAGFLALAFLPDAFSGQRRRDDGKRRARATDDGKMAR